MRAPAWGWFIDVCSRWPAWCSASTGLFLLHLHARQRRLTWPLVGLGLVVPLLLDPAVHPLNPSSITEANSMSRVPCRRHPVPSPSSGLLSLRRPTPPN
jgi:hypothetical protein